jgi:hypothetical protein
MAGPKRLSPRVVRSIFKSKEPAPTTAKRYKVSANLVYLIKARRIHKATTMGLKSPQMARRETRNRAAGASIDMGRLADAISKKVVLELVRRLGGKG